ncbi:CopD family protein [Candidatus Methylomirabilis sp.]|uniref:copper resistance D family protein n=1 Tax=Candidatus Methylomirabilis sp. TaxID=2032687 RepID=UPI002A5C3589|nr:CopD family protein [Candidatus Methylomirabilis sp.]
MTGPHALLHIFIRWLEFMGLMTLVGGLAFQSLILPPSLLSRHDYQIIEGHLRRVELVSLGLVVLTSLADLILRTLMMSGGGLATLGVALPLVLRKTHYGTIWTVRIGLLGLLGMAWWLRLQGIATPPRLLWIARLGRIGLLGMTWWLRLLGGTASPWFIRASFLATFLVALTTTLSGHAADWGDMTVPVLIGWFHLLAVSIWIGGLFTFGFVLKRSLATPGMQDTVHGLSSIARPFSKMAASCVAVFLATGLYNSWLQVGSASALVEAAYGWTLLVKLALVGGILMIAAVNRYYFLALLMHRSGRADGLIFRIIRRFTSMPQSQFSRFVRLEWMIVVATLACSALLTQLMPARHARHLEHLKSQELHGDHLPAHDTPTAMPPSMHR